MKRLLFLAAILALLAGAVGAAKWGDWGTPIYFHLDGFGVEKSARTETIYLKLYYGFGKQTKEARLLALTRAQALELAWQLKEAAK